MTDGSLETTVTQTEMNLLRSIRNLPESLFKDRVQNFLLELTTFLDDAHCAEAQGDGIPCESTDHDCLHCERMQMMLTAIADKLRSPFPA